MVLSMSGVLGVWLPSMVVAGVVVVGGGAASEQFSQIRSFRDILRPEQKIYSISSAGKS